MQDLLTNGNLLISLVISALAGFISFFSPCVLPLVPGYLAYVSGSAATVKHRVSGAAADRADITASAPGAGNAALAGRAGIKANLWHNEGIANITNTTNQKRYHRALCASVDMRLLLGVLLFVAGFTVIFTAFFAFAGSVGAWLVAHEKTITQILGIIIMILGLVFIGVLKPLQRSVKLGIKPAVGLAGAPLLGAVFALGWTPCMGPTLSVILALSLQDANAARGAILGIFYCLGLGLPFVLLAAGFSWMTNFSNWMKRHIRQVNILGGMGLIAIGALMATGLWAAMLYALQAWIGGVTLPL